MKLLLARLTIGLLTLTAGAVAMALEKPEYEILFKDGNYEYRLYSPYLVAETEVEGTDAYNEAANEGFMRLFRYISGANNSQDEIAMTAPVQQVPAGEKIAMTAPVQQEPRADGWLIAFMLPGKYTLDTAPTPTDPRIRIREVPGRMMAVVRYSGRWTQNNFSKYENRLRERLASDGIAATSEAESAVYNAPFMPPFLRRNEIMLEVQAYPTAAGTDVARADSQS